MRFYHVWFSTKGRKAALRGDIAEAVIARFRQVAAEIGSEIAEAEPAFDHVHLLLGLHPNQDLPGVMQRLKGAAARDFSSNSMSFVWT